MPFKKGESGNPDMMFKPGQSGNPAGKVAVPDLKELILQNVTREDFAAVLVKLSAMAKSGNIKAIQELLDRTYGKVTQVVKNDNNNYNYDAEKLTPEKIREIQKALENDY